MDVKQNGRFLAVEWQAVSGAAASGAGAAANGAVKEYRIRYGTVGANYPGIVTDVGSAQTSITLDASGATSGVYYGAVVAYDGDGEGDFSEEKSVDLK